MAITYAPEPGLTAADFRGVLLSSGLAERRPANEPERLELMLRRADIIITARDGSRLVGVSRAITDYAFCCYLSDLAVDVAYQGRGIGRQLIMETRAAAGEAATLFLVAAPAAEGYYPHIGMERVNSCWKISRSR